MLHFQINPQSGVPVYRQMIDQIKYYVASGALKAEDQLPSIRVDRVFRGSICSFQVHAFICSAAYVLRELAEGLF